MENKELSILKNSDGQSTIEYLLVLLVVISLGFTVFTSDAMKSLFGSESSVFAAIRARVEYSYRHALPGSVDNSNYSTSHDSYLNINKAGKTRFFAPKGKYPQ